MVTPGNKLTEDLLQLLDFIESQVDGIISSAPTIQSRIADMLLQQIHLFEIKDNKFLPSQDLRKRMLYIEERFEKILREKTYADSVFSYLNSFATIVDKNAALHQTYNALEVDIRKLRPARQQIYYQAREALYGSGIRFFYKEPVNHLLLLKVTTGGSVSEMEKLLKQWSNGNFSAGSRSPTGKPIPNLEQYSTQLARDTIYQFNGTINEIIRDEYSLDGIHYSGDIIADSRPLCIYMINLNRDVSLSELRTILSRHDLKPGRIPGTTASNFCVNRGGYGCRHIAFPVRIKRA